MSTLFSGYITKEKLREILATLESKSLKGFAFTGSISEESNQYGQNISFYAEQSKEQREAKDKKYYFASGKVFWTDNKITLAEKKQEVATDKTDDLPF